jgi:hypothetical protein
MKKRKPRKLKKQLKRDKQVLIDLSVWLVKGLLAIAAYKVIINEYEKKK